MSERRNGRVAWVGVAALVLAGCASSERMAAEAQARRLHAEIIKEDYCPYVPRECRRCFSAFGYPQPVEHPSCSEE